MGISDAKPWFVAAGLSRMAVCPILAREVTKTVPVGSSRVEHDFRPLSVIFALGITYKAVTTL